MLFLKKERHYNGFPYKWYAININQFYTTGLIL